MLVCLAWTFGIAACSGVSRAGLAPAPPSTTVFPTATAVVTFSLPRTTPATAARHVSYVSPSSTLFSYSATNGTNVSSQSNLALSGYCATSGGSTACTIPLAVPIGNVTLTVTLSGTNGALSTKTVTLSSPIVEGSSNVVGPLVLDPIASTISVSSASTPVGSTTAVPVTLAAFDAQTQPIVGLGTYVTGTGDNAATLSLSLADGSSSGDLFSTSSTCSSPAVTFSSFSPASTLYVCPIAVTTLGTIYTTHLGGVSTSFSVRRTGFTPTQVTSYLVNYPATTNLDIESIEATNVSTELFAAAAGDESTHTGRMVFVGNYVGSPWVPCTQANNEGPAVIANDGAHLISVKGGFAALYQFDVTSSACTLSASQPASGTGADAVAMLVDSDPTTNAVYAITDNQTTNCVVLEILVANQPPTLSGAGGNCATYGNLASLTIGPGHVLWVGAFNTTTIRSYRIVPALTSVGSSTVAITGANGTGAYVSGNADVLYAVTVDGFGKNIQIWTVTNGTATLAYTYPNTNAALLTQNYLSTIEWVARPIIVGNDDRLYLAVGVGGTTEIDQYDPYLNLLTPSAISLASFDTTQPVTLSRGQNGTILVGGSVPATNRPLAIGWP